MFRSFARFSALVLFYSSACILTLHASVGTESWSQDLGYSIYASPVVRDLDGDGDYEILISSRWYYDESGNPIVGQVHLLDDQGQALAGWPQQIEVDSGAYPFVEISPSVGDIDGDGQLDVVVGDVLGYLHAWEIDGTAKPFTAGGRSDNRLPLDGGIKAVVRFIDVDQDGADELLVHTGSSKLYLLNGDGSNYGTKWPIELGGAVENQYSNRPLESSPLALDFDYDGTMEIAVATTGGEVHLYDIDGNPLWKVSTTSSSDQNHSSLVAADLDGDYQLELVLAGADQKLHAWHANGTPVYGFPTQQLGAAFTGSVAVADLHSEPGQELVVADKNGTVYCFSSDGALLWEQQPFNFGTPGSGNASPIIVDLNNDSSLEIVVPHRGNYLRAFNSATGGLLDWPDLRVTIKSGDNVIIPEADVIGVASQMSTPVCANIDSDLNLELLYISPTGSLSCYELNTSGDHAINSAAFGWNGFLGDRGELSNGPTGDRDSDLISDDYERYYFGSTEYAADDDFDLDGVSNYVEWGAGTNPTDASDLLSIDGITFAIGDEGEDVVELTWKTKVGHRYDIYSRKQLDGSWSLAEPNVDFGNNSQITWPVQLDPAAAQCFYAIGASRAFVSE
jgi:hypothetical protein